MSNNKPFDANFSFGPGREKGQPFTFKGTAEGDIPVKVESVEVKDHLVIPKDALFINLHTGLPRDARDVASDPKGDLIQVPNATELKLQSDYAQLRAVLEDAYQQAATGKGHDRHANGLPFQEQRMLGISRLLDSERGMAYQVCKKVIEGLDLPTLDRKVAELLGAINYIAGIVIFLNEKDEPQQQGGVHIAMKMYSAKITKVVEAMVKGDELAPHPGRLQVKQAAEDYVKKFSGFLLTKLLVNEFGVSNYTDLDKDAYARFVDRCNQQLDDVRKFLP